MEVVGIMATGNQDKYVVELVFKEWDTVIKHQIFGVMSEESKPCTDDKAELIAMIKGVKIANTFPQHKLTRIFWGDTSNYNCARNLLNMTKTLTYRDEVVKNRKLWMELKDVRGEVKFQKVTIGKVKEYHDNLKQLLKGEGVTHIVPDLTDAGISYEEWLKV